ncbi:S-adenosylmethionine-dependent methyltransferases (SAM or AdoMet-MTase) class I [Kitasatospora sp. Ki12]
MSDQQTTSRPSTAEELRHQLADRLLADRKIRTSAVETTMRTVPRELFVPGVPLTTAYADDIVSIKTDEAGTSISAASQPRIVAMMLEQLQVEPGHRVLELGAGTGYNAALLAHLTGPAGRVVTIDVDDDLVRGARANLARAGIGSVDVVLGDGRLGHPSEAPFDRITATVGAFEVPRAWLDQLHPAGRLLVPVRLAGAVSRTVPFVSDGHGGWVGDGSEMAGFMPLRDPGTTPAASSTIDLTGTGAATLQSNRDNLHATDPAALTGVLNTRHTTVPTGVFVGRQESFEQLYLWLACRLPNPPMWLRSSKDAVPGLPAQTMATTAGGSLAHLGYHLTEDGGDRFELDFHGYGPGGAALAAQLAAEAALWDHRFRNHPAVIAIPASPPAADPDRGRFVLARPTTPMTVTWTTEDPR